MEHIGQRIRDLRKKAGLTQEKLAQELGVTFQAVSKWEKGVNIPDTARLIPLARVLGVTTDELLGFSEELDHEEECCQK